MLHVSATAFGGGVSEILYTLVPLMNDAGIDAEWQVMLGREEFYNATKRLHNALQGAPDSLADEEWEVYFRYNEMNAAEITSGWDVVIVHDRSRRHPEARPTSRRRGYGAATSISRRQSRGDRAHRPARQRVRRIRLARPGLRARRHGRRHAGRPHLPARDRPALAKEHGALAEDAAFVCDQFGIDVDRPLMMCQVSFDPWKDPIGVIDAYRLVAQEMPEVSSP